MQTTDAIILAAGFGSRLDAEEGHKLLVELNSQTLLDRHLANFSRLGIRRVLVVTGHRGDALARRLSSWDTPPGMSLSCVQNPEFDGPNGWSVLAGADALWQSSAQRPFWLTMSDHLFDPRIFEDLAGRFSHWRAPAWQGALVIDQKLDSIFDMPDATKVRLQTPPFAIGKELEEFDAVDAGLFWCAPGFVEALRAHRRESGSCSTSDAVRRLVHADRFGFWDLGPYLWQDVDTPEARAHAEALLSANFQLS